MPISSKRGGVQILAASRRPTSFCPDDAPWPANYSNPFTRIAVELCLARQPGGALAVPPPGRPTAQKSTLPPAPRRARGQYLLSRRRSQVDIVNTCTSQPKVSSALWRNCTAFPCSQSAERESDVRERDRLSALRIDPHRRRRLQYHSCEIRGGCDESSRRAASSLHQNMANISVVGTTAERAILVADLPEPGASLTGGSPPVSGPHRSIGTVAKRGQRLIWGARASERVALYVTTLVATRRYVEVERR